MSPSAGALIWISCRPLIRLAAGVASGFLITKADIFPPVAARGAGQVALNITLPSLLFSKIVPAFTTDNIKALGPLVLVAVLYEALGIALASFIKQFFWVPHRFRFGLLIAGGWGNVGDVATAVILSLTGNAPFQGIEDQNLAVAYISVFILVFIITLFPLGFHRWLVWDFAGPDVESEAMQAKIKARRQRVLRFFLLKGRQGTSLPQSEASPRDEEKAVVPAEMTQQSTSNNQFSIPDDSTTVVMSPHDPFNTSPEPLQGLNPQTTNTNVSTAEKTPSPVPTVSPTLSRTWSHRMRITYHYCLSSVKGMFNPVSVAIYVSLPISLVPKLKALFIEVPGVHMPPAPDGQPPLAFIQDIATFIGGASIPIGLICLGSSLARLNVPLNQWRKLPVGAISCLAIGKMVITPVLGVLICHGLVQSGVIFKDDRVLIFVCMFFSCLPTATTQVYLTQVYSGTGTAEHLAAFLIPQYVLMFISMTALNVYAIHTLF